MICFEIFINGKRVTRAGIPGFAVLHAIIGWVNRRPRPGLIKPYSNLHLDVGGLDSNGPDWEMGTHLDWVKTDVSPGDTIEVRIVEAEQADPPRSSRPRGAKAALDDRKEKSRKHYLALYKQQRRQLDAQIAELERDGKRIASRKRTPNRKPRAGAR